MEASIINVGLFILPGFHTMSFIPLTVFEVANLHLQNTAYRVTLVSEFGGKVVGSSGIQVRSERIGDCALDTLLIGAAPGNGDDNEGTASRVAENARNTRRYALIGNAALILGSTGMLAGRHVAIDRFNEAQLTRLEPGCQADLGRAVVVDAPMWSCVGMSSGTDLALALVEDDFGRDVALNVSTIMAMRERRELGQMLPEPRVKTVDSPDRIQRAMSFARDNLRSEITVYSLADAARLSPRQFSRVFRSETGVPPGAAIERLRVEAARLMLTQGKLTSDAIAVEAGFGDTIRMEKALQKTENFGARRSA